LAQLIGTPHLANHLVSTAFCGVGFFAGKIKDKRTTPPKKFLSPGKARELQLSAPEQQVMI
jgi:hypothetical protein